MILEHHENFEVGRSTKQRSTVDGREKGRSRAFPFASSKTKHARWPLLLLYRPRAYESPGIHKVATNDGSRIRSTIRPLISPQAGVHVIRSAPPLSSSPRAPVACIRHSHREQEEYGGLPDNSGRESDSVPNHDQSEWKSITHWSKKSQRFPILKERVK